MEKENEVIELEVKLTPEDLFAFQKHLVKKGLKPYVFILAGIAFLMTLLMIITSEVGMAGKLIRLAGLFIVPILFTVTILRALKKSSQKAFTESKLIHQTQRFSISEDSIQVASDSGYSKVKWTDLYAAEETRENYLFYISKQQAYVIAKRYLLEDGQHALIRSFIALAPVAKKDHRIAIYLLVGFAVFITLFLSVFLTIINLL